MLSHLRLPYLLLLVAAAVAAPTTLRAVVISEIYYNAAPGDERLEFVEIAADTTTPEDLSGYALVDGVFYEFLPGTILEPGERLVVCADVNAVRERFGIENAVGNYLGVLEANGERLTLVDSSGVELQSVDFDDRGKWPVEADGTGHTLSLRSLRLDTGEPESWTFSREVGGTPGALNFSAHPQVVEETLLNAAALWRYRRGVEPFSIPANAWRAADFDDAAWESAPAPFGYSDGVAAAAFGTILDDMQGDYATVAIRGRFEMTAEALAEGAMPEGGELFLAIAFDDGICAFVNGVEVARANCGEPLATLSWDALASGERETDLEQFFHVPNEVLVEGENVVAISGHNVALESPDFLLAPRIVRLRDAMVVDRHQTLFFNELFRGVAAGEGWVELYNGDTQALDVSGYHVTNHPLNEPFVIPDGSVIGARGYLVLSEAETGLNFAVQGLRLFLIEPGGRTLAGVVFEGRPELDNGLDGYVEARYPDGGPLEWISPLATPGAANEVVAETDLVINEILYHPPFDALEERPGEFVELFNRSDRTIDLTDFRFDKGIRYVFAPGTTIGPRGYLVVAQNPDWLETTYGLDGVWGPYEGRLSNRGERLRLLDALGNPVDSVRYYDGGEWPRWADGGGSSLELIDPEQDNRFPSAWAASDESMKSEWETLQFAVPEYEPAEESELHVYLADRGSCLLDNVSVIDVDGENRIPNSGFEGTTAPWIIEGTHRSSRRVTYDAFDGEACLELNASSKGDTTVNRIEIDTVPPMEAGAYTVAVSGRWLRGTNLLVVHGEFTEGPYCCGAGPSTNISGNSMASRLRWTIPEALGTPGSVNSATLALEEANGEVNSGPIVAQLSQHPALPAPQLPLLIRVRVSDSDGVGTVRLHYRLGSPRGVFAVAEMRDNGVGPDSAPADGIYSAEIPGQVDGSRIVYYVSATDASGRERRFPEAAPDETRVAAVSAPRARRLDRVTLVLDDAQLEELETRPVHSNALLPGALIFNENRVYHEVGVRYRGSPWGRPARSNYRIRFPKDDEFLRGMREVNLSSKALTGREAVGYFMVGRAGTRSKPAPTSDYLYVDSVVNGEALGTQALIQPVNNAYLRKWYGPDAVGPVLKAVGRLSFDDSGVRAAWDGAQFIHKQVESENYRGYYVHIVQQTADDWSSLAELTRFMDARHTDDIEFDLEVENVLDLEAFLRVFAVRVLAADWDAFGVGNGHNSYLVRDSRDGRWELLPFDLDNAWGDPRPQLFPDVDPDVERFLSRPGVRRVYLQVLWDMIHDYWNPEAPAPFLDALERLAGIPSAAYQSYLAESVEHVRAEVERFAEPAFRLFTADGVDITGTAITVDSDRIEIHGEAPVQVATIVVGRGDDDFRQLHPAWRDIGHWSVEIGLELEHTPLEFMAFTTTGDIVAAATVDVESTVNAKIPVISSWFPQNGPAVGGAAVFFGGENLTDVVEVRFGNGVSTRLSVDSPRNLRVWTPPAAYPLPPDATVDIRFLFAGGREVVLEKAHNYDDAVGAPFLRGDVNGDGVLEVSDGLRSLLVLLGEPAGCIAAMDSDANGEIDIADPMVILNHLYLAGPPPPAPYPMCGILGIEVDCESSCR